MSLDVESELREAMSDTVQKTAADGELTFVFKTVLEFRS